MNNRVLLTISTSENVLPLSPSPLVSSLHLAACPLTLPESPARLNASLHLFSGDLGAFYRAASVGKHCETHLEVLCPR